MFLINSVTYFLGHLVYTFLCLNFQTTADHDFILEMRFRLLKSLFHLWPFLLLHFSRQYNQMITMKYLYYLHNPFSVGYQVLWPLYWLNISPPIFVSLKVVDSTSCSSVLSPHLSLLTSPLTLAILEDVPPVVLAPLGGIFQQMFGSKKLLVASAIPSLLSWIVIAARPASIPFLLSSRWPLLSSFSPITTGIALSISPQAVLWHLQLITHCQHLPGRNCPWRPSSSLETVWSDSERFAQFYHGLIFSRLLAEVLVLFWYLSFSSFPVHLESRPSAVESSHFLDSLVPFSSLKAQTSLICKWRCI